MSQEMEWLLKEKYAGETSDDFFADCKRLALGEPLGYIIGYVPFLNCKIWLDSHPLIPRVETEFWVEHAITEMRRGATKSPRVLDLCAGSGCIGIAVASAIEDATVDFSEIDLSHMPTIEKNLAENNIARERAVIYHANLFAGIDETYDFIFSNPPYIDPLLLRTEESVLKHEPYIALFGGDEGLEVITTIISEAPTHLNRTGQLWLEHEPEQSERIRELGEKVGFVATTHPDQYGVERFSVLVLQ